MWRMVGWTVAMAWWVGHVGGLEFDMLYQSKCLTDEIERGVLVVGEYDAHDKNDHTKPMDINVKVRSKPMEKKKQRRNEKRPRGRTNRREPDRRTADPTHVRAGGRSKRTRALRSKRKSGRYVQLQHQSGRGIQDVLHGTGHRHLQKNQNRLGVENRCGSHRLGCHRQERELGRHGEGTDEARRNHQRSLRSNAAHEKERSRNERSQRSDEFKGGVVQRLLVAGLHHRRRMATVVPQTILRTKKGPVIKRPGTAGKHAWCPQAPPQETHHNMHASRPLHARVLEANGPNVGEEAQKQMHEARPSKHRAARNAKIGVDDAR